VYSGRVAGYAFRALRDQAAAGSAPDTAVILGFSHRMGFEGVAVMDGDAIETPLGVTDLDRAAGELLCKGRPRIRFDYGPHAGEHSAENQIPFVQAALPNARLVVALVGDHDGETLKEVVEGLRDLGQGKRIVVVASSDMLHDPDYGLVGKTDRATLKKVAALDVQGVLRDWRGDHQIFCGIMPVAAVMRYAIGLGCKGAGVLHYRNNGDDDPSARGQWVVGYSATVFPVP
jgi:MEMO1 family protein